MSDAGQKPGDSEPPENVASEFTQELIAELAGNYFQYHAWRRFITRSWARSLEDIGESAARTRSFWSWAVATAAIGFGVVLLVWTFHTAELAIFALVMWLPWYASSVVFVLTHLGMVDDDHGLAHSSLLVPNGLSFLRLALAPVVLVPFLGLPVHPVTGPAFAVFIAGMSVTDILDGWIARRQNICTRLGRMLDILADLALLTFLAIGLYWAGAIPQSLLWLLVARYPILLVGTVVLYIARGPVPLKPTLIGKVATFATSIVLLIIACTFLIPVDWPPQAWMNSSIWWLQMLIATNILYLFYRGVVWKGLIDSARHQ